MSGIRSFRQPCYKRAGVAATVSGLLHIGVELIDHARSSGSEMPFAARLAEADAEILAHPIDGEAEIVLALGHGQSPGSPSASSAPRRLEMTSISVLASRPVATACATCSARPGPCNTPAIADLVDHLGQAAPRPPGTDAADHALGVGLQHRLGSGRTWPSSPPTMIVSVAVDRAGLAARNGGVETAETLVGGGLGQLAGDVGRGRGVVDEQSRPGLHAGERCRRLPSVTWREVVVVADAGHDHVAWRRRPRPGSRRRCRHVRRPIFRPSRPSGSRR
jgi:hypothetical protein